MSYEDKLKDPLWDEKRKEILQRDEYTCKICGSSGVELHIHHKYYSYNTEPWEYKDDCYISLCKDCHGDEHTKLTELDNSFVDIMRKSFMADEIEKIMIGFDCIKPDHVPEISSSMIMWLLSNREALDICFRMYFLFLPKGNE